MDTRSYIKNNTTFKKVSLSVDTLFRPNYNTTSATDFVYELPAPIENVLSMTITALEIPNFWYLFSKAKKNNRFTITVYNYKVKDTTNKNNPPIKIPSTTYTIEFPDGNYVNVDFVNLINAHFSNMGGGLDYIIVEIDVNTGKTIFRARHKIDNALLPGPYDSTTPYYSPDFYFSLDFRILEEENRPLYKNMGWMLGFIKPFYLVTVDNVRKSLFIPNTLTTVNREVEFKGYCASESVYGNTLYSYIFLDLDDYNKSFSSDVIAACLPNTYLEGNNIIARITVHSLSNSINLTTAAEAILKTREYYGPVTISRLNIRLLDKFGDVLQLNQNDFSFLIEFTTLNK
jgi:hypothetical protein